jgi:DNA-binding IscR family transcriptional regulator
MVTAEVGIEHVLAALDPNGAVMKYGEIVGQIASDLGVPPNTIYGEIGQILQRMKHAGSVELVKGKGSGWRRMAARSTAVREESR